VQALVDAEQAAVASVGGNWFDNYHPNVEINAYLDGLAAAHPLRASTLSIGTSIENRPIYGIAISTGGAGKPAILLNSCQHAREWVSPMVTTYIADQLLNQYGVDPVITSLVDNIDFYILPVINPDGYEYSWIEERFWRKNRRNNGDGTFGVDLNRNWAYAWGGPGSSGNTQSDIYRGTAPFSEPETAALRDFILAHPEIRAHVDFHSYSQVILFPWGYDYEYRTPTLDATELRGLGQTMAADMLTSGGATYKAGPIAGLLYVASGGSVDWVYGNNGICSCTIELRDRGQFGFVLPEDQILPTAIENLDGIKVLADWVDSASFVRLYHTPAELPVVGAPNQPHEISVQARTWPGATLDETSVQLWHRFDAGDQFTSIAMTAGASPLFRTFSTELPATPCVKDVEYYFEASSLEGETVFLPTGAPTETFMLPIEEIQITENENFETATGWLNSVSDTATRGRWERVVPIGISLSSSGNYAINFAQPDFDHTPNPGQYCYLTGNGPNTQPNPNFVNGVTTLTSPMFDASGEGEAYVSFWAFFNNFGNASDNLEVLISNDDGASWTTLILMNTPTYVTPETAYWKRFLYRAGDFVAPTNQLRLRFVARNNAPASNTVEAAIDDIAVFLVQCPQVPGDIDGDGIVDLMDHDDFVDCLEGPQIIVPANCLEADLQPDGDVDMIDFIEFAHTLEES
jgi:hypothetical protein